MPASLVRRFVALSLLSSADAAAQSPAPPAPTVIVLRSARLIDGTGAAPITDGLGGVTRDRITAVGPASRMQVAVQSLGFTGGHGDENGFEPGLMGGDPTRDIRVMERVSFVMRGGVVYEQGTTTMPAAFP